MPGHDLTLDTVLARLAAVEARILELEGRQSTIATFTPIAHGIELALLKLGVAVAERAARDGA